MEKLVTILTPCYNTGKYIERLLVSILSQTYSNIEMIVIDDGSTDNTKDIVNKYIQLFENRNYSLNYIYQDNQGQSVAINNGLKLVKGDYLAWPDSDDFYATNDAITKMVERLESLSEEFAMVRCKMQILDEDNNNVIGTRGDFAQKEEKWDLFEDCLRGNFYFYPGCYMVRFADFLSSNGLDIYTEKDAGQNWQMFLPILYKFRCSTINEYLFNVLARSTSHSRGQYKGVKRTLQKWDAYERTILATLDKIESMPRVIKDEYKTEIKIQYVLRKFDFVAINNAVSFIKEYRDLLKTYQSYHIKQKIYFILAYIPNSLKLLLWANSKIRNFFK